MERRRMPENPRPVFDPPLSANALDRIISFVRQNTIIVFLYTWLTDTLVPLVLAVVIVVPVGAVVLVFFLPKCYRNWRRRLRYGVTVIGAYYWVTPHDE